MTLNPNDPRLKAFQSNVNLTGLDLRRSTVQSDPGMYVADPAAVFRSGQVLTLNAAGSLVLCDGLSAAPTNIPFGFAKWSKATSLIAANVDEAIILNGVVATNLAKATLFGTAGTVAVRSAPNMGGTTYVETTDYVVNYVNGQITRNGGGAIPSGGTVYVTYQYTVADADLDFQGRNFFNFVDDVTIANGRITVIQAFAILFTTMYDPSQTYTMGQQLYVDGGAKAGLLTNQNGGGQPKFARVFQLPLAGDPFMGITTLGYAT